MESNSDLIYDVGLCDGGDTAYYLFRGYRVVAVDANPLMIERAQSRFAYEIAANRLTLLNVGISDTPGTATFWVSERAEWSSFDRAVASRSGTPHKAVPVPTLPFHEILAEHGVPHYLKIDIEGNDRYCVEALAAAELPKHISVESECVGDSAELADPEALQMLELLRSVGYKRFKLVNQGGWSPVRPSALARYGLRLATSASRGRLRAVGLARIANRFTDKARIAALGFDFSPGSSGPWGDDIPGAWMGFDKARCLYLQVRRSFFSRPSLSSFWYDWHATY
jgi:FkbM family methyltransferase